MIRFSQYIAEVFDTAPKSIKTVTSIDAVRDARGLWRPQSNYRDRNIDARRKFDPDRIFPPRGEYHYTFGDGTRRYFVEIAHRTEIDTWYLVWGSTGRYNVVRGETYKHPFKAYGLYTNVILKHFQEHPISKKEVIFFEGDGGPEQERIYRKMCQIWAEKLNLTWFSYPIDQHVGYKLTKK